MDIVLSKNSNLPLYRQIEESIREGILNRSIKPDELLPSIRVLSSELKTSVITIKSAYEELEKDGYIYSLPGKGFYATNFNDEQIKLLQTSIAKSSLKSQIDYLRRIGMSEEDIKKFFNCIFIHSINCRLVVKPFTFSGKMHIKITFFTLGFIVYANTPIT